MPIPKLLVATLLAAAPLGIASAQSTTPADSGHEGHHLRQWLTGTGAAASAGLFLAFTHSGNDAATGFTTPGLHGTNQPAASDPGQPSAPGPTPQPTTGSTPPGDVTDSTTATPPGDGATSTPAPSTNAPNGDDNTPATTNPVGPTDDTPPPDQGMMPPDASTVPEPGSAALLATGIVGLVPLLRKRRK